MSLISESARVLANDRFVHLTEATSIIDGFRADRALAMERSSNWESLVMRAGQSKCLIFFGLTIRLGVQIGF